MSAYVILILVLIGLVAGVFGGFVGLGRWDAGGIHRVVWL